VLVLIGKQWLKAQDEHGRRRIDIETDWVRREVEEALKVEGRCVPVLVDDASPVPAEALSNLPTMVNLAHCQAAKLRTPDWDTDFRKLVVRLQAMGVPVVTQVPDVPSVDRDRQLEQLLASYQLAVEREWQERWADDTADNKPPFIDTQGLRLLLQTERPQQYLHPEYFRVGRRTQSTTKLHPRAPFRAFLAFRGSTPPCQITARDGTTKGTNYTKAVGGLVVVMGVSRLPSVPVQALACAPGNRHAKRTHLALLVNFGIHPKLPYERIVNGAARPTTLLTGNAPAPLFRAFRVIRGCLSGVAKAEVATTNGTNDTKQESSPKSNNQASAAGPSDKFRPRQTRQRERTDCRAARLTSEGPRWAIVTSAVSLMHSPATTRR